MTRKAYVFDAYGTLFDVHAAIAKPAAPMPTVCRNFGARNSSNIPGR
jgi:FMN phosphatase YigB (HAD superfamily)